MSLIDPFSFERPKRKKVDEQLFQAGGFRMFDSNFIGPKYTAGEFAPDTIDLPTAYKYINTPSKSIPDQIAKIHDFYYYLAKNTQDIRKADQFVIDMVDKLYPRMNFTEKVQASTMKKAFQAKLLLPDSFLQPESFSNLSYETEQALQDYIDAENIRTASQLDIGSLATIQSLTEKESTAGALFEALPPFKKYITDLVPSLKEQEDYKVYAELVRRGDQKESNIAPTRVPVVPKVPKLTLAEALRDLELLTALASLPESSKAVPETKGEELLKLQKIRFLDF